MNLEIAQKRYLAACKIRNKLYKLGRLSPQENDILTRTLKAVNNWQGYLRQHKKAAEIKVKKKNKFCARCCGIAKRKCPVCGQSRILDECEKEGMEYLLSTWHKLKRFKMKSTGCPSFDYQIRCEFGDWTMLKEPYLV